MPTKTLSDEQFKYYKRTVDKDVEHHNKELEKYNSPEEVIMGFNGKFKDSDSSMAECHLFIGAMTILPSLFYQLPKVTVRSKRGESLQFEASVLTGLVNASLCDRDKEENQLAIIDAFLPYGFSVIKNGYNSRVQKAEQKVEQKTPSIFTGQSKSDKTNDMEGDNEYIEFEQAISLRQSPKHTYLDSSQPFGKGNRITFEYTRTLQQLIESNLYDLSSNFISYFSARGKDKREIELNLFEHWTIQKGRVYKLSYVDGWQEPLKWVRTEYKKIPASYLRFNKIGDILYAVSHGTLGLRAQKELNYLNELWKKHIDNLRNQHLIWEEALSESGKKTLKQNDIGGIVSTTKPIVQGIAAPLQSATVDPALFGNIESVRQYLQLVLSTTGGKAGGPESELATTERSKALGDVLRSSGMQDAIRDFMIDQIKHRIRNYLTFGTPEMVIRLTGENLFMPMTGKPIEPNSEMRLGGVDGLLLQELISGDLDVDFIFDVDIQSAARPDYPVIRKQLAEGITLAAQFEGALRAQGKKVNLGALITDYFSTFDAIPDNDKYIQDMTPEEIEAYQLQQQQAMQMEMVRKGGKPIEQAMTQGVPSEGSIETGANEVPTGVEGLE